LSFCWRSRCLATTGVLIIGPVCESMIGPSQRNTALRVFAGNFPQITFPLACDMRVTERSITTLPIASESSKAHFVMSLAS